MTSKPAAIFRQHRIFLLLSVVYLLLGILRLNDLSLYTDSTRYVIWGNSFAHGKGLVDDTQPEPERYVVNAPLFSVVLSPVLLLFPMSLVAAKVWTLFIGVFFLAAFYAFLARLFGRSLALVGIIPLVFNPLVVLLSTEVLSETTFLFATAACFLLIDRMESDPPGSRPNFIMLLVITSFVIVLREVAIALVGAVILCFLFSKNYKRALLVTLLAALIVGGWMYRNLVLVGAPAASQASNVNFIFEHFLTPPGSSLAGEFVQRFSTNLSGYALHLAGLIFFPVPDKLIVEPSGVFLACYKAMGSLKYIIPFLFVPLFLAGLWRDLANRKNALVRALFVAGYLLIILLYPVFDIRFLIPLVPLDIFYVICALKWLDEKVHSAPARKMFTAWALALLVAVPNIICIAELESTNIRYERDPLTFYDNLQHSGLNKTLFAKPWRILADTIRRRTPEAATIAGSLKEICIFIGDRKLLELNGAVPVTTFEQHLRSYAAEYVMATSSSDKFLSYEFQMGESRRYWFEHLSNVAGMHLYKVRSTFTAPRDVWLSTKRVAVDTSTSTGLLRLARWELLRGQFDAAISLLRQARHLDQTQVQIQYQLVIAYALGGRIDEATRELQVLCQYGQSTTFLPIASKIIEIASSQLRVEASENLSERSTLSVNTARFYWSLGYYGQAYKTIKGSLSKDSTYFVGLLWGWEYGMQMGDTAQARAYLRQLNAIDRSNVVVRQFGLIGQYADSLRRCTSPGERSRLRMAIAESYRIVDLPDESIDEALRASNENPDSGSPWLFQARLYEEKKMPFAARAAYKHLLEVDPGSTEAKSALALTSQ
ncbi:MAG TPA: hypothetical protein VMH23_18120 [Bacteroidota bacterium]|nr:hypothetical protein [Bacteroidota bacterium]